VVVGMNAIEGFGVDGVIVVGLAIVNGFKDVVVVDVLLFVEQGGSTVHEIGPQ